MNGPHLHADMFYDNHSLRSPAHRHQTQTLHRQASRHFDAYGQVQNGLNGLYTAEDHAARYDSPRYNDRQNATIHGNYGGYDTMGGAQAWNTGTFNQHNALAALGATTRMKPSTRGRSALPSAWLDQSAPPVPSLPSFAGLGNNTNHAVSPMRTETIGSDQDEDLIPTAIVIKNIPFAVKKESLVQLMSDMRLPLPYAFNYHFDNGVFRGLAFANFTSAEETAVVIESMNHFELQGRKLRVEYKKMLPLAERERIEREKRERRGQLEEQHRPMGNSQLHSQPSMSSMSSHVRASSPSPVSARTTKMGSDVDMNDPQSLQFYGQLLLFKEDLSRDALAFPSSLSPPQRRMVHTLAHHMGLAHVSKGTGEQRQVHIFRLQGGPNVSPPIPQMPNVQSADGTRRGLNRAATTDFSDVRASDDFYALQRQVSGFLGFPNSPGGLTAGQNLRAAKSFADLRSYTPSPVPSTASFPATLGNNLSRYTDYGRDSNTSGTSTLTPTTTSMSTRDEGLLVSGLGSMTLSNGFGGSPRSLRGVMSWDRSDNPGPIGGHRSLTTNYDDQARDRSQQRGLPSRQPRGPVPERGTGFGTTRGRQNGHLGRSSDELSNQSNVEITVEH
ncbi:putative R3H domain protein [Cryomyces antarcticus]